MWIGLVNPNLNGCTDGSCASKLSWNLDEASYDGSATSVGGIKIDNPKYCMRMGKDLKIEEDGCSSGKKFACQFDCNNVQQPGRLTD